MLTISASAYGASFGGWHEAPHHHVLAPGAMDVPIRPI